MILRSSTQASARTNGARVRRADLSLVIISLAVYECVYVSANYKFQHIMLSNFRVLRDMDFRCLKNLKGYQIGSPKLLILIVARDEVEPPARGFSGFSAVLFAFPGSADLFHPGQYAQASFFSNDHVSIFIDRINRLDLLVII
jgi:hypothetical protein